MSKKKTKTKKKSLGETVKNARPEPLWLGPYVDGVTQSLLQDFITCRERFRAKVIDGLGEKESFSKSLEYGNMFHLCEEVSFSSDRKNAWVTPLRELASSYVKQYPTQQEEIEQCYQCCKVQFPIYREHYRETDKTSGLKPISSEVTFCVPIVLPHLRTVWLRGKWDGIETMGKKLWLKENKTSSGQESIQDTIDKLKYDFQTMTYLVALEQYLRIQTGKEELDIEEVEEYILPAKGFLEKRQMKYPIGGIDYNCVIRPLSGGRHSIKQKQNQTVDEFYEELAERIDGDREFFFKRFEVDNISSSDINFFRNRTLIPLLTQLCDWWDWLNSGDPFHPWATEDYENIHWLTPLGLFNPIARARRGGSPSTAMDPFVLEGEQTGLVRQSTLFPELLD